MSDDWLAAEWWDSFYIQWSECTTRNCFLSVGVWSHQTQLKGVWLCSWQSKQGRGFSPAVRICTCCALFWDFFVCCFTWHSKLGRGFYLKTPLYLGAWPLSWSTPLYSWGVVSSLIDTHPTWGVSSISIDIPLSWDVASMSQWNGCGLSISVTQWRGCAFSLCFSPIKGGVVWISPS